MAFNRNSSAARSSVTAETNTSWKAQGFLNFYLPSKDGGRRKLAGIPLKDTKANEKALREWLEQNPEENLRTFINKLEVDYQPAAQSEGSTFDLTTPT